MIDQKSGRRQGGEGRQGVREDSMVRGKGSIFPPVDENAHLQVEGSKAIV